MSGESVVTPPKARKLHDADVVYLYDGSFEGFLCCVFESFAQHEIPFAVWTPQRMSSSSFSSCPERKSRQTRYSVSRPSFFPRLEKTRRALVESVSMSRTG